jgi:Na+/melibiose symporter-like transporter
MIVITGYVLQFAGFVPNEEQTMFVKLAIMSLYGLFPLVCYLIGAAVFTRFKLDEAEHQRIRADLDSR